MKAAWVMAVILIVIALAAIGVWLALGLSKGPPSRAPSPTPSPTTLAPSPEGKTITDASRLFSITLPAGWKVTESEGKKGVQLARLAAESQDFVLRRDEEANQPFIPHYYEQGATFSIHVVRGRQEVVAEGAQTPGSRSITIDDVTGTLRTVNEPSTLQGQDLDAIVHKDGLNYIFRFAYNPDTYPQGEQVFREIVDSFLFL